MSISECVKFIFNVMKMYITIIFKEDTSIHNSGSLNVLERFWFGFVSLRE
jgi:hypothetical protein